MSATAQKQQQQAGTELLELWSVTELLKAVGASRPIVEWHCEQTALAALESRPVIDAMLKTDTLAEVVKWIKGKRWSVSERHKIRGTVVHHAAEALALGRDPGVIDAEYQPYVDQLARWLDTWQPVFELSEAPVFNRSEGYAGTLDGIMALTDALGERRRLIFDYKTTPKGPEAKSRPPYSEVSLQLSAYAHAEEVDLVRAAEASRDEDEWKRRYYTYDPTRTYEPMPKVDGGICIVVSPVDCFAQYVSVGDVPYHSFLHARDFVFWNEKLWRNAFGQKLVAKAAT